MHGSLDETPEDGVKEEQLLVVETSTLPTKDWIKMRSYASMAEFLYFNKILQIPLLITHHLSKSTFRKMFEHFMNVNDKEILKKVSKIFNDHSIKITQGRSSLYIKRVGWTYIGPEFAYIGCLK